ncbi:MAG: FAD-dependent oxidoreductase, partial [Shewanella sp.]
MKNIAIVGTGISGLTCAHLFSQAHKVTVFEANDYIGGHTATVDVQHAGQTYAIDTGFIVFNDRTYPRFERLLARLKVNILPTEMSFSVHHALTGLEYNGHHFASLFAQKRNLFSLRFWRFLNEILRFNKACKLIYQLDNYPEGNLGDFLDKQQFSPFFAEHYILPMGAAIWSSSIADMRAFSLRFFIQFFEHHGLLNVSDRPQWYVLE